MAGDVGIDVVAPPLPTMVLPPHGNQVLHRTTCETIREIRLVVVKRYGGLIV
jgi:hypothetical protein